MSGRGENGCGGDGLQLVLEGDGNSLHFHLQPEEGFVYMITLIFIHSLTYTEKICSMPGIVISPGMSGTPIF